MNAESAGSPVLTSWKEIARYMGKGVRTVQRWEQDFGLPVRRPQSSEKKAILARPRDLDAWVAIRCGTRGGSGIGDSPSAEVSSLCARSSLAAEIETSRMLRTTNRALRAEMRSALEQLREQLSDLQQRAA